MAFNFASHKIAAGTAPWTTLYHQYVQDVEDGLNYFDTWRNNTVTTTFSNHLSRIGAIETWQTNTATPSFNNHDSRLSSLESWKTNTVTTELSSHNTRISSLETWKTNTVTTELSSHNTRISSLESWKTNTVTPELSSHNTRVGVIESWKTNTVTPELSSHNTRVGALESWKTNTVTPELSTHNTRLNTIDTWRNEADTISQFSIPLKTWITVVETYLVDSYTYTYQELFPGTRTRSLANGGLKTYNTLSLRLDRMEMVIDYLQDFIKSIGSSYVDETGTVVPGTTPNP